MRRPTVRLALVVAAAAIAAAAPGTMPSSHAQDGGDPAAERERRVEELIARLRNPFFEADAERVRVLAGELVAIGGAKADGAIRAALGGTSAHPNVVEQVARAALADPSLRFIEDVTARMHADSGSDLERRILPLFDHASPAVVRRLCDIAGDLRRGTGLRRTAIRLLGRTGDGAALPTIAAAWSGADRDLHAESKAAFDAVLPVGAATAADALALVERMRREDLTVAEILRAALREKARVSAAPAASPQSEAYRRMAAEMLPAADLDQVIRLFLIGSPVSEVRADAARRLAAFPWDAAPSGAGGAPPVRDDDGRRRAFTALMDALRREESGDAEREFLRALVALAPGVRGAVRSEDVDLVASRIAAGRQAPEAARDVRLLATRLLGEIRDERALPALESAFDSLRGGDAELRVALLEAMQPIPLDRSAWLAERLAAETHGKVLRKLATLLGRSRDPRAAAAFRGLLERHEDPAIRGDAARHLGTLWAGAEVAEARAALLQVGLADREPSVRTVSIGALSYPGPGAAEILPRLRDVAKIDTDEGVRGAAVKSILDLDLDRAPEYLLPLLGERPELWALWRDRLVAGLGRRETTPVRVLAAASALDGASQRPLAVELLTACAAPKDGALKDADGLARVRERLAGLLLDEGRPAEAETWARSLLAESVPSDAPADIAVASRREFLLDRALVASGSAAKRAEAETRLLAFAATPRIGAADLARANVLLAECRVLLLDAWGALAALETPLPPDADDSLRRRRDIVSDDAKRLAAEDRRRAFELVDQRAAATGPEAVTRIDATLASLGSRAARPVREALSNSEEPQRIRRLLAAAEAFGAPRAELKEASTLDEWRTAVRAACEALDRVQRPVPEAVER